MPPFPLQQYREPKIKGNWCEKHKTINYPGECFYCHYDYPEFLTFWEIIKKFIKKFSK